MKKLWCSVIALVLVLSMVFGMTGAVAEEKVKLVFWDECPGTVQTPVFKALLDEFMAENPNIEVEYVGIPWDSAKEKYDVAIASNATPDVASIHNSWLSEYALKGAIKPLDEQFNAWEDAAQFSAGVINATRAAAHDGKLYAIPYTDNLPVIWVRTDLFAEKGVAIPATWDDFFKAVEAMTDLEKGEYGFAIRGGAGGAGQLLHGIIAYSGMKEYFVDGKCQLNNEKAVEYVEKIASLYNVYTAAGDITSGLGETVSAFDSGVAAMIMHNLGSYGDHKAVIDDDKFQAIPYPAAVTGDLTTAGSMWCSYVTFENTEHPEECWKLIQFLASKHGVSAYNEAIGQLPTRADVAEEPWMATAPHIKTALEYTAQPGVVSVAEQTHLTTWSGTISNMIPMFQETLAGGMTAQEFLDEFAAGLQEGYDEYIAQ